MDYFEVFGLPRRLGIDAEELQRRFYELARRYHPDFHQGAAADDLAAAEERSALVNAAYRALRDPITRAEYLVRLEEGRATREGAADKPKAPPELLAEMFEIQEALQDAKAGGLDAAARATLVAQRGWLGERHEAEGGRIGGPLSQRWDAAAGAGERETVLRELKEALATRAYLKTVIDDLSAALGEVEESYVTHRRH
jgi:molecular chaperone HscB